MEFYAPPLRRVLWFLGLLGGALGPASADEPKAKDLLDAATAFYRSQGALEARATITLSAGLPGQPIQAEQEIQQTIKLKRPDQYALVSSGQGPFFRSPTAYLNEKKATLILEGQGRIEADGIDTVGGLLLSPVLGYDEAAFGNIVFDQNLALAFLHKLLFAEVGRGWRADLAGVQYVGESAVGKRPAHHLRLTTETRQFGERATMDLNIWIQQGEQPFLLKFQPELSKLFPAPEKGEALPEIKMVSTWSGWNAAPKFDKGDFEAPAAGKDDRVFPSFDALMHAQMASQNPALTLTGNEAEDFTVPLLSGEKFALRELRGKRIAVIGFWTTWGSPDGALLKSLDRVRMELKDRDVSVIGISLGEDAKTVSAFLQNLPVATLQNVPISVPIGLDEKQELVAKYKVRSIPQTVVVGRDGEVKQVHIGVDAAFAGELLDELKSLLEEDLPPPTP